MRQKVNEQVVFELKISLNWDVILENVSRNCVLKNPDDIFLVFVLFIEALQSFCFCFWDFDRDHFGKNGIFWSLLRIFVNFRAHTEKRMHTHTWSWHVLHFIKITGIAVVKWCLCNHYFIYASFKSSLSKFNALWLYKLNVVENVFILSRIWISWSRIF